MQTVYRSYGIMRSGIHVVLAWVMRKLPNNSVLFYNNIRQPHILDDRLIKITDTRVDSIREKLTNDTTAASYMMKSFESRGFVDLDTQYETEPVNILNMRNPYNLLASSKKYNEVNGTCKDILVDEPLKRMWKEYAQEFLGITNNIPNKVCILYDLFISSPEYRYLKAEQLGLSTDPNDLVTLGMGGGSSFKTTNTNYTSRELEYKDNAAMQGYKDDEELSELWKQVYDQEYKLIQ